MGDLVRQTVTPTAPMVTGSGLFFKLIETAAPVSITFVRGGATKKTNGIEAGYQYGPVPESLRFDKVVLSSASSQSVAALIGDEYEDYARIVGLVQIQQATALETLDDEGVTTTAAVVLPANAARRRGIVRAASANTDDIRIGDAAISLTRGIRLEPGQSYTVDSKDDVYAIAMSGAQTVELLEETG